MSPPEEVESEDYLQRFVQEHAHVIASYVPGGSEEGGDDSKQQQKALEELELVASLAACHISSPRTIAAAGIVLPDAADAAEGRGEGRQEVWWLFFRDGQMVGQYSLCK